MQHQDREHSGLGHDPCVDAEYLDYDECVESGQHLVDCDDDGYCNVCGCNENEVPPKPLEFEEYRLLWPPLEGLWDRPYLGSTVYASPHGATTGRTMGHNRALAVKHNVTPEIVKARVIVEPD